MHGFVPCRKCDCIAVGLLEHGSQSNDPHKIEWPALRLSATEEASGFLWCGTDARLGRIVQNRIHDFSSLTVQQTAIAGCALEGKLLLV